MLQISGGAMRFGDRTLFDGLDLLIQPTDRLGVVGANGTGKSTLLKILLGLEQLDEGEINRQKGLRVGYLPQDGLTFTGRTVFEECLSVFDEAIALEKEQDELTHKMSDVDPASDEYADVVERYTWVMDRYHVLDGYTKEVQAGTVLGGLAFPRADWDRPTQEFSGGWQMRIALAKLLLEKPNILLLDEPTNHLDLEARNWLEGYLEDYPNAFLLISHDRFFLDVTITQVLELWNQKVHFYKGNYSKYEVQKVERREQLLAAYRNQKIRIEQLEAFINKFRYQATRAKLVQSRVKELEKVERIQIPPQEKSIHFKFPQPTASGRIVAELTSVAKSYGETKVFDDVSLTIEKGDRIALVGVNGAGKSTLIRLLAGIDPLTAGGRKLGHKVEVDYFAQDQYKELDPDGVLFDEIGALAPRMADAEIRSLLGCFLFSGDDVFKQVRVLSGGERNRFALAKMLLQPRNFLLLDEPTNHLDLQAKDVLLRALLDFSGTLVFVSHDRYFIDRLATKVFGIGGGEVEIYPGNYEDYLWTLGRRGDQAGESRYSKPSEALASALAQAKTGKNGSTAPKKTRRVNPIKTEKLKKRASELEDEITGLEADSKRIQGEIESSGRDFERQSRLLEKLEKYRHGISKREQEWGELTEKIEQSGRGPV